MSDAEGGSELGICTDPGAMKHLPFFPDEQREAPDASHMATHIILWHVSSLRSDVPYLLGHKEISYDVHFPLSLSPLFRGAVSPLLFSIGKGAPELWTFGRTSYHIRARTHTTFDPFSDTWRIDHPSQTCIVCGLHHEAWSCEETGSEEHMRQRMRIVRLI